MRCAFRRGSPRTAFPAGRCSSACGLRVASPSRGPGGGDDVTALVEEPIPGVKAELEVAAITPGRSPAVAGADHLSFDVEPDDFELVAAAHVPADPHGAVVVRLVEAVVPVHAGDHRRQHERLECVCEAEGMRVARRIAERTCCLHDREPGGARVAGRVMALDAVQVRGHVVQALAIGLSEPPGRLKERLGHEQPGGGHAGATAEVALTEWAAVASMHDAAESACCRCRILTTPGIVFDVTAQSSHWIDLFASHSDEHLSC